MESRSSVRLSLAARLPPRSQVDANRWIGYSHRVGTESPRPFPHARPRIQTHEGRTIRYRVSRTVTKLARTEPLRPWSKLAVRDGSCLARDQPHRCARNVS